MSMHSLWMNLNLDLNSLYLLFRGTMRTLFDLSSACSVSPRSCNILVSIEPSLFIAAMTAWFSLLFSHRFRIARTTHWIITEKVGQGCTKKEYVVHYSWKKKMQLDENRKKGYVDFLHQLSSNPKEVESHQVLAPEKRIEF